MAIQYSGGTLVNTTFTSDGTRSQIVSQLESALTTAGWSVISGSGTGDVLMETAASENGTKCRFRFYDPGANNCAQITMKNVAGTLTSGIAYLLPVNGETWRIWANKFSFFIFKSGIVPNEARRFCCGGTLWTPPWLGIGDGSVGFMQYNGNADTDTATNWNVFRVACSALAAGSYYCPSYGLYNGVMVNMYAARYGIGLAFPSFVFQDGGRACYWQDGSSLVFEALMGWSPNSSGSTTAKWKGILCDAIVLNGKWDSETVITYDSKTWLIITHQSQNDYIDATLALRIT